MSKVALMEHMHADIEELKRDMALVRHLLSEEGKLTDDAKKMLADARATPDSAYISQVQELKKHVFS